MFSVEGFFSITPMVIIAIGILWSLLHDRRFIPSVTLLFALSSAVTLKSPGLVFSGLLTVDHLTTTLWIIICTAAFLISLFGDDDEIDENREFSVLLLGATLGALVFVSANELLTIFVGLELLSLPLYCMCGAALRSKASAESALKYFILGSFSSAFFLFGVSLFYGISGTTFLGEGIAATGNSISLPLFMMAVGVLFKIGAAPFHFWVPDVYEGATMKATAFMASVVKVAAVGVAVRLFTLGFGASAPAMERVFWIAAFFSLVVGSVGALRQTSLKRLLGYSSIGHVGYLLIGLLMVEDGTPSILFYLASYALTSVGVFAVLLSITPHSLVSDLQGLYYRSRRSALSLTFLLLSLAGLPPAVLGFLGKTQIFLGGVSRGYSGLVIVAAVTSVISLAVYIRVISGMYLAEQSSDSRSKIRGIPSLIGVGVVVALVVLSLLPEPLLAWVSGSLH